MLSINTNLSSLLAQNSMKSSTNKLNQAIERMTTGFKINQAKDNAANYSISNNMTTQIGAYEVAEENATMGLDMVATITSNLELISDHVQRIRDLCEQASNGTYGEESLKAIQAEINSRLQEIERIKENTEYNGISLLEPPTDSNTSNSTPLLASVTPLTTEEANALGYTIVTDADEFITALDNGDSICLGNDIDLSEKSVTYAYGGIYTLTADLSHQIIEGNGYTITLPSSIDVSSSPTFYFGNVTNADIKNVVFKYQSSNTTSAMTSLINTVSGNVVVENCAIVGTLENDNFRGIAESITSGSLTIRDTYVDVSFLGGGGTGAPVGFVGNTNGLLNTYNSYYNSDVFVAGDGGISAEELNAILAAAQPTPVAGDLNINLQVGINGDNNSQINFIASIALEALAISVADSDTARSNLQTLDDYLNKISTKQTELGAVSNRLQSVLEEIAIKYDNLVSSRSTLRDADIAEVSSTYIQQQILQQASATLLATANQHPSIALSLL